MSTRRECSDRTARMRILIWTFAVHMWHKNPFLLCLFVLRFYGPVNPIGTCRSRSISYPHFYWAGLVLWAVNQYCAHSYARNWQLSFLNQRKGESDRRKYFMINLHERMLPTRRGSNPQPPDLQSDAHPTEPPRPALSYYVHYIHVT